MLLEHFLSAKIQRKSWNKKLKCEQINSTQVLVALEARFLLQLISQFVGRSLKMTTLSASSLEGRSKQRLESVAATPSSQLRWCLMKNRPPQKPQVESSLTSPGKMSLAAQLLLDVFTLTVHCAQTLNRRLNDCCFT